MLRLRQLAVAVIRDFADEGGYSERMFFLQMSENDLVTGQILSIPERYRGDSRSVK